jgi:magnesium-protoporphyrin O-methyltransferase
MFDDRIARHEAKRFRRKGLTVRARRLLAAIESALPLNRMRSLEVGAGIGGLTISLLRRGVTRASIVDASSAYVVTARLLADEMGVGDRLDIECGDFVERADALEPVDLVVLDRVVCCYPAWQQLLPAAAHKANRALAFTWPRDVWWSRAGVAFINFALRFRASPFRVFVHPTRAMREALASLGFGTRIAGYWGPWEVVLAERSSMR